MRFDPRRAAHILLVCTLASGALSAQRTVPNREITGTTTRKLRKSDHPDADRPVSRSLNLDEGLSILGAALEARVHLAAKSDCSHLVHAIYEHAGFPYEYARSSDLYVGSSEFRRVQRPQPGDLVVWPGHVGIAISPAQHSFFSALHSGLGVDKYDAAYWQKRGKPRFYRYVKAPGTVDASNTRLARLTPTTLESGESRNKDAAAANGPGFHDPEDAETQSIAAQSDAQPSDRAILRMAVINSTRPKNDEVAEAASQAFENNGEALSGKNGFGLPQPLVVFDRLEVERVRVERDKGWASVKLRGSLSVTGTDVKHRAGEERQRWLLYRRDENSWAVVLPQDALYLPRGAAVRVLAHQLATLTDDRQSASVREKAKLARLLSTLLGQQ